MTTPIYDAVADDLGWSPDQLSAPFDLAGFVADSRARITAHKSLMAAADSAKDRPLRSVSTPRKPRAPKKKG